MTPRPTFYVLDAHAQIHRAYHAPFRYLSVTCGCVLNSGERQRAGRPWPDCPYCNGEGREPTKATYVFTKNLLKLLNTHHPAYFVCAADTGRDKLVRRKKFPAYKAHRDEPMPDLAPQVRRCLQIVRALGIPVVTAEGWEADDVIATYVDALQGSDVDVAIVGRDKDLMQLIGPGVRMFDPMTDEWLDGRHVHKKYGVYNYQMADYQALVGDGTDGFKGVPGIGEKGATEILARHTSVDNFFRTTHAKADLTRPEKLLFDNAGAFEACRELATLNRDVPLPDLPLEGYKAPAKVGKAAKLIFRTLGFQRWDS